jgi:hypothetical protein
MRTLMLTSLVLGSTLAAPPLALADPATYGQVVLAAQKVREEAKEVKLLLRHRAADQAVLQQRLSIIESHAQSLKTAIGEVKVADAHLTSKQLEALERAKSAAETLLVLLNNKATIIADATKLEKQRGLLQAKADGIAQRALIVEKQMERLRG